VKTGYETGLVRYNYRNFGQFLTCFYVLTPAVEPDLLNSWCLWNRKSVLFKCIWRRILL